MPSIADMISHDNVVLDIEIQDPIIHQEDWDKTDQIKISCCVLYSYLEGEYHIYGPNDINELRSRLMVADKIITYNGDKFDLPIIFQMPNRTMPEGLKSFDILKNIWISLGLDPTFFTPAHKGYSLNLVAKATIGMGKSGSGANAPFLYKQGNLWKVIDYCMHDVFVTKSLYDFIAVNGYVNDRYGHAIQMSVGD